MGKRSRRNKLSKNGVTMSKEKVKEAEENKEESITKLKSFLTQTVIPTGATLFPAFLFQEEIKRIRFLVFIAFIFIVVEIIIYYLIIDKSLKEIKKQSKLKFILIYIGFWILAAILFYISLLIGSKFNPDNPRGSTDHESIIILIEDKEAVETYYQLEGTTKTVLGSDLSLIPETSSESIEKTRTNSRYGKIATVSGDYKTIFTDTFNGENNEEYATIDHVDLLEGVETIEEKAFYKCGKLQSISLPKSIKLIDDNAFVECDNLTLIVYENSYAFDYCVEKDLEYELAQ